MSIVPNTSMLFKIKHLPENYVLVLIFGPLGFFRTVIRTSCFIISYNKWADLVFNTFVLILGPSLIQFELIKSYLISYFLKSMKLV